MSERKQATRKGLEAAAERRASAKQRADQRRKVRELASEGARKHARTLDELAK
jgi:hypothetical protein